MALKQVYLETITSVMDFLTGKDDTLAYRICNLDFLPKGHRRAQLEDDMDWAFGNMGIRDRARFFCTLYLEELGDLLKATVGPEFGFSRYAERIAMSATSFDGLEEALLKEESYTDALLLGCLKKHLEAEKPELVALTVPFPGNLYGALKCGQFIKKHYPHIKVAIGGGYCNTELRELSDPRLFDYVDFVTLDDGEGPVQKIIEHCRAERNLEELLRTFVCIDGQVQVMDGAKDRRVPHAEVGAPDYQGLPLDSYLSVIDLANPVHRLWSDGCWNKLTIAHGCYWKKCSFCDISLDYIGRYEQAPATLLVDRMEELIAQTGHTGFHFVDEAAPPMAMRDLALEILRRGLKVTWWTNIRFEKTFTKDLCQLLAQSGCIAVTGGLEVASNRLLALMEKGVSIEQVAQVTNAFTEAGIMVHAYLMYGFPTQTEQETIDSLEVVRQLFLNGCIQSGFWHRFSMTAHSPVGLNPEKYGVHLIGPEKGGFAWNDLQHDDPQGCYHADFSEGLNKAIYNYMHGIGVEDDVREWFDFETPETTHPEWMIEEALQRPDKKDLNRWEDCLVWLGQGLELEKKKGKQRLWIYAVDKEECVVGNGQELQFLVEQLPLLSPKKFQGDTLKAFASSFEKSTGGEFVKFLKSDAWRALRRSGLLLLRNSRATS